MIGSLGPERSPDRNCGAVEGNPSGLHSDVWLSEVHICAYLRDMDTDT